MGNVEGLFLESAGTRYLDSVWEKAQRIPAIVACISGMPGSGKSSMVRSWIDHYERPVVWYDAAYRNIYHTEVERCPIDDYVPEGGVELVSNERLAQLLQPVVDKVDYIFTPDEVDAMDDAVVVIDSYDLAGEARPALLHFLRTLEVTDPRVGGARHVRRVAPKMFVVVWNSLNTQDFTPDEKRLLGT
ncbi:MAG: hypothetical protein J5755_01590 [Clostridia bacterium]|nr:hypothetical protein [Clostridia bacterium]